MGYIDDCMLTIANEQADSFVRAVEENLKIFIYNTTVHHKIKFDVHKLKYLEYADKIDMEVKVGRCTITKSYEFRYPYRTKDSKKPKKDDDTSKFFSSGILNHNINFL